MKDHWMDPAWRGWCRTAVEQVRFRPDHDAIAKELAAHLEDHRADLERLGYDRPLATERTLRAMGDPVEVGRAMDKAHKPLIGWLWKISRWLVMLALAVCLLNAWSAVWNRQLPDVGAWLEPAYDEVFSSYGYQRLACPPSFQTGAYTIEVEQVLYDRDQETGRGNLTIGLRSRTWKFWLEGPVLGRYLEAADSSGARYTWYGSPYVGGSGPNDGHFQNTMWIGVNGIEGDPAWIDISHRTAGWTFRIELPGGEEGAS